MQVSAEAMPGGSGRGTSGERGCRAGGGGWKGVDANPGTRRWPPPPPLSCRQPSSLLPRPPPRPARSRISRGSPPAPRMEEPSRRAADYTCRWGTAGAALPAREGCGAGERRRPQRCHPGPGPRKIAPRLRPAPGGDRQGPAARPRGAARGRGPGGIAEPSVTIGLRDGQWGRGEVPAGGRSEGFRGIRGAEGSPCPGS